MTAVVALPAAFEAKLDRSGECWIWTGAVSGRGYGQFVHDGGSRSTHRLAYTWLVAPIPEGLTIDHLCRVKTCCNPEHLEAVTSRENIDRALAARGFTPRADRPDASAVANLGGRPAGPVTHGRVSTYTNQRCRCAPCKSAKADDKRKYRARKRRVDSLPQAS